MNLIKTKKLGTGHQTEQFFKVNYFVWPQSSDFVIHKWLINYHSIANNNL